MTRELGPNQRRILSILLRHDQPMTSDEILNQLTQAERAAWGQRQPNLSQVLAGLMRRGLVRREGGNWVTVDGTRRRLPLRVTVVEPSTSERG